jgi:hypothetical protein
MVGGESPYFHLLEFMTCQQRLQMPGVGMVLALTQPLQLGATLTVQRPIL